MVGSGCKQRQGTAGAGEGWRLHIGRTRKSVQRDGETREEIRWGLLDLRDRAENDCEDCEDWRIGRIVNIVRTVGLWRLWGLEKRWIKRHHDLMRRSGRNVLGHKHKAEYLWVEKVTDERCYSLR